MIGIFGGTFDPVHNGHLRVVQALVRTLPFDELRLLPCGQPAHRAPPLASAGDRVAMLRLAIAGMSSVVIDECEVQREGPSFMVDTLASMREAQGDVALVLIIGWDAFVALPTWERWQQILELAHLLVVQRPGNVTQPCSEVETLLQQHRVDDVTALQASSAGGILLHPVDALEVSSTEVRASIAIKEDAGNLLPAAVLAYIKEHNLYQCN